MKGFGMEVSGRVTFSRNQAETTYCRESNGVCVCVVLSLQINGIRSLKIISHLVLIWVVMRRL